MTSHELGPVSGGDSALKSLLRNAVDVRKAGAVMPRDLVQFGILGSTLLIATGLLALILPSAWAIQNSDFYLVLGGWVASLDSFMGPVAGVLIAIGVVLLAVDLVLTQVRTSERWRSVVVGQAVAGGVGGAFSTVFLALVLLNLGIWIGICVLGLVIIGMIFGAMAGG